MTNEYEDWANHVIEMAHQHKAGGGYEDMTDGQIIMTAFDQEIPEENVPDIEVLRSLVKLVVDEGI